jgi:hypothetical protein
LSGVFYEEKTAEQRNGRTGTLRRSADCLTDTDTTKKMATRSEEPTPTEKIEEQRLMGEHICKYERGGRMSV